MVLDQLRQKALGCTDCPLAKGRTQVVFGAGDPAAQLMFVGEGPGHDEDIAGEPFVGRSGKLLDRLIHEELGLDRKDVYIANVVMCRPPGNRDPAPDELAACAPHLAAKLDAIDPAVVVTLGRFASQSLLRTTDGITALRGRYYPFRRGYLVPTFHPAAALRGGGEVLAQMRADFIRAKRLMSAPRP